MSNHCRKNVACPQQDGHEGPCFRAPNLYVPIPDAKFEQIRQEARETNRELMHRLAGGDGAQR
jgi:hypothetical protein